MQHQLVQYQIDAFTTRAFSGNPAAVCPLDHWLDDELLQAIAEENNLSETAFFVPSARGFELRWFTPVKEIDLCGHATLASAHVLFEVLGYGESLITFETRSGDLFVCKNGALLEMDFPANAPTPCGSVPELLRTGLGRSPLEVLSADVYVAVFDSESTVRSIRPDHSLLSHLDLRAVIVGGRSQSPNSTDGQLKGVVVSRVQKEIQLRNRENCPAVHLFAVRPAPGCVLNYFSGPMQY